MATYPRFLPRLRGTFFPFLRASDSAIAIACLRLVTLPPFPPLPLRSVPRFRRRIARSEEHTSELQSHVNLVCRLLLEKKKKKKISKNLQQEKQKKLDN